MSRKLDPLVRDADPDPYQNVRIRHTGLFSEHVLLRCLGTI